MSVNDINRRMAEENLCTMHRGRRYDIAERRELRRTTINDTPEAMLQVG